jgi:adenylate cyclase
VKKAFEGFLYPFGGFFVWGGDSVNTEEFKRKLTAILSADVAGYSRLMAEDETATVKTLETYRDVMSTLIKQHRGRVIDSPGDNLLAEFTSVVDAVQCAVAVQKEFQARNAELPENRRMEFRIGVNLGDVIEEGERIYGDGVNIAARLEALADPGGICVSKTAFDHIESKLPLGYEYLGEQPVKNIPKPVGAYRVLMEPRVTVAEEIEKEKPVPAWQRKTILAAGVVLVLVVIAALIWNFYLRPPPMEVASVEKMALPLPEKPSIAVLAFTNMSGDPEQEDFSDGLTEEIITTLSKVSDLLVIARQSTFSYKGKAVKIKQVAEELGVRYVLEGSVRKEENRVRITAQLIDALTGHHLWAETYDREVTGVFAVQDEIKKKIITALEVKLTEGEQARLFAKGTDNVEAWVLGVKAWKLAVKYSKENHAKARELLERAIELDPDYGFLWTVLAHTHFIDGRFRWSKSRAESFRLAAEFTKKALTIDQEDPFAHSLLGGIYLLQRQHEKAIAEGQKAIALDPNYADGYAILSQTMRLSGRLEEALILIKKAMRLCPIPRVFYPLMLGWAYVELGRYEDAIPVFKQIDERCRKGECPPWVGPQGLIVAYMGLGREEEARAEAEEYLRMRPTASLESTRKGSPVKDPAQLERYLSALRKAGIPEKPPLPLPDKPSIAVLPFVNMSGDPEQEYFADGMTDDLITDLSKISALFVTARNSTFQYKGKPVNVKKVGQELGVRYILEGSVRKVGQKVRINAQLIDATTGGHLWAERFDGKMDDIFELQDKINGKIVSAMAVRLAVDEEAKVSYRGTKNIPAYDEFLKGMKNYYLYTPESFAKALSHFRKALSFDPKYGKANAALALTYWNGTNLGSEGLAALGENWDQARRLAEHYLKLAMKSPTAVPHQVASEILLMLRQHDEAIREARQAISIDPNDPNGHLIMAFGLIMSGRPKEAIDFAQKAMKLDPFNAGRPLALLGLASFSNGEIEEASELIERALRHNPKLLEMKAVLAACYGTLGKTKKAKSALDSYTEHMHWPWANLKRLMSHWPFQDMHVSDRFADGVIKAGLPGTGGGYYKILKENGLAGDVIKSLLFGRKVEGVDREGYHEWSVKRTRDGKATSEFQRAAGDWVETGSSWIEGDMICNDFPFFNVEGEHCGYIFRNPHANSEMKYEYLMVTSFGIYPFSPVE